MARYGAAGAHLVRAARNLDALDLARSVGGLDLWGPVFPLIEAAAFLPFGSTYRTASGLMVALFVLTVLAGFWAGRQLGGAGGDLAGALVAASVAVSPAFQLFGMLVMLEIPGALLLFLAVGSYLRALRTGRPRDFAVACLAAVLLFFLKFNYGLAWLVPVALAEVWLAARTSASLRAEIVTRLRSVDWHRPWPVFLLAYAAGLLALALFGGRVAGPAGETTRAISLGTPLYALYLLVLGRALMRPRGSWMRLKAWYAGAGSRLRTIALVVLLPIGVWMLAPFHARAFVRVLENRSAGPSLWSALGLLFYPRTLLHEFSPSVAVGAVCLVLATVAVIRWSRLAISHRVVALAFLLGLAAILAHPYKLARFLFPLVPLLWLTAAAGVTAAIDWLVRARQRTLVFSIAPPLVLAVAILAPVDRARLAAGLAENGVPASVRAVARAAAQVAASAHRSVLVGYWNDFSPGLLEWEGWQAVPAFAAGDVPRPADQVLRDSGPERLPELAARRGEVGAVLILDLRPGGSAWRQGWTRENAWLEPARVAVEKDPRWRLAAENVFPASGYRLRVYARAPGGQPRP